MRTILSHKTKSIWTRLCSLSLLFSINRYFDVNHLHALHLTLINKTFSVLRPIVNEIIEKGKRQNCVYSVHTKYLDNSSSQSLRIRFSSYVFTMKYFSFFSRRAFYAYFAHICRVWAFFLFPLFMYASDSRVYYYRRRCSSK